ncbi:MAG: FCD domain-containing protein [Gammaproteobacteria bacterium]|nr:FCD domain-containing protein [Gammaproteobacteria bacterium]
MRAKTLVESSYNRLRSDIIAGKLTPGAKLRIEELRDDYRIGASPLREALNRLAGEGFVTVEEQRGFKVAPVSPDDLKDLSRMRTMLECEALRESIGNGDDEWEANLVAAHHRLQKAERSFGRNLDEWEQRNEEFHEALVAACASSWLLRLRHVLYEQHKRYRFISILSHQQDRDVHREHREILEAALARDVQAAIEATERHIQLTLESSIRVFSVLDKNNREPDSPLQLVQ